MRSERLIEEIREFGTGRVLMQTHQVIQLCDDFRDFVKDQATEYCLKEAHGPQWYCTCTKCERVRNEQQEEINRVLANIEKEPLKYAQWLREKPIYIEGDGVSGE